MSPALRLLRKLAQNNRLANRRLLTACAGLAPGEFAAPRTGFFPSLQATLNHILVVDWFYVDALEGGTLGSKAWADEVPRPELAALTAAQVDVDDRLLAVVAGLGSDAALAAEVRIHRTGRIQVERTDDLLLHLFMHQTHHRGQAHAMLSGTSVAPPQLDEFLTGGVGDVAARRPDLAALGWSEAELMG